MFDCAGIPTFAAACIGHVFNMACLGAALLLQIWGADFVKHAISERARYRSDYLVSLSLSVDTESFGAACTFPCPAT